MRRSAQRYRAAFIGTATLMPVVATLVTTALYIALYNVPPLFVFGPGLSTIVVGAAFTLVFWWLAAIFFLPYTSPEGADRYSYDLLSNRLSQLQVWLKLVQDTVNAPPAAYSVNVYSRELLQHITNAQEYFNRSGEIWTSGIGYVIVSRLLHRAEGALIMFEPLKALIADGSRIEVAIGDSTLGNKEYYLRILERALDYLSPNRFQRSQGSGARETKAVRVASSAIPSEMGKIGGSSDPTQIGQEMETFSEPDARAAISEANYAFNEFQDDQWERLVHVRSQLLRLTVLTGLVLYILLIFMVVIKVLPLVLVASTIFFLIGAGVGLFSRLYEQARVESLIDNTRLAGVRLMAALLFSGLAAIGGVAIMQKVATPSGEGSFSLTLFNILIAAAFGLAPNLFFSAIRQQVGAVDKSKKT